MYKFFNSNNTTALKIFFLIVLLLTSSTYTLAQSNCYTSCCEQQIQQPKSLNPNNYYGDCPCFKSASELRDAIGDSVLPTSCMIDNTFGVLTGGPTRFTSRDSGGVFNCFFRNLNDNDQLTQIVEYDDNDKVYKMHMACNAVIREFARNYNLKCK